LNCGGGCWCFGGGRRLCRRGGGSHNGGTGVKACVASEWANILPFGFTPISCTFNRGIALAWQQVTALDIVEVTAFGWIWQTVACSLSALWIKSSLAHNALVFRAPRVVPEGRVSFVEALENATIHPFVYFVTPICLVTLCAVSRRVWLTCCPSSVVKFCAVRVVEESFLTLVTCFVEIVASYCTDPKAVPVVGLERDHKVSFYFVVNRDDLCGVGQPLSHAINRWSCLTKCLCLIESPSAISLSFSVFLVAVVHVVLCVVRPKRVPHILWSTLAGFRGVGLAFCRSLVHPKSPVRSAH